MNVAMIAAEHGHSDSTVFQRLKFWVPAIAVAATLIISDFRYRYAEEAAGVDTEADLVEIVGETTKLRQLALLGLGGLGVLLVVATQHRVAQSRFIIFAIGAVVAYATTSVLWSESPGTTARRALILILVFLATFGIGRAWQTIQLVKAVFYISCLFALLGIAAELRFGTFMAKAEYRFAGMLHPNVQALNCGMLALSACALARETARVRYLGPMAAAFGLILLTGSRGGTLACLFSVVVFLILTAPPRRRFFFGVAACAMVALLMLYIAVRPGANRSFDNLSRLGRQEAGADPSTLTGRIPIWFEIVEHIQEKPLLGYGYGAFWSPKRVHNLSYILDWQFSNAHSIYLETLVNLGAVGFALLLMVIVAVFKRGVGILRVSRDTGVAFTLSLFAMGALNGLVEAIFVNVGFQMLILLIGSFQIAYYDPSESGLQPC
ncbi:MAG: O-antigen ligase family protein [Planctomycetales bacterium]|nr:O-antigen ligase family protein [Planctomycetales bacterium]